MFFHQYIEGHLQLFKLSTNIGNAVPLHLMGGKIQTVIRGLDCRDNR